MENKSLSCYMIIQSRGVISNDKFWGLHMGINLQNWSILLHISIKLSVFLAKLLNMNNFLCSKATSNLCATTTMTETRKINKQNKHSERAAH